MIGPNGAGKSTLLRVISGDRAPSSGAIRLKGRTPADYGPRELALRRAVLAQSVSVAFPFSVIEVVRMGAGERTGPAIETMVEAALSDVDLLGMRDRIVNTLSGGEQQRTHFARVMVQLACGEVAPRAGLAVARRTDIEPRPSSPARSVVRGAALRCARRYGGGGAARPQSRSDVCGSYSRDEKQAHRRGWLARPNDHRE